MNCTINHKNVRCHRLHFGYSLEVWLFDISDKSCVFWQLKQLFSVCGFLTGLILFVHFHEKMASPVIDPLDLLTNKENRKTSFLRDIYNPAACTAAGFGLACAFNWGFRRPIFSGRFWSDVTATIFLLCPFPDMPRSPKSCWPSSSRNFSGYLPGQEAQWSFIHPRCCFEALRRIASWRLPPNRWVELCIFSCFSSNVLVFAHRTKEICRRLRAMGANSLILLIGLTKDRSRRIN